MADEFCGVFVQIAVVAVMSKPHRCPHIAVTGNICVYCPGGPDSDFEYSTQSYTGYEVGFQGPQQVYVADDCYALQPTGPS